MRAWRACALFVVTLLALAAPARGQDTPEKFLDQLGPMIDGGAFVTFVELMEPRRNMLVGTLATSPSKLRRVCDTVEARWSMLLGEHPAEVEKLDAALAEACIKALQAKKDDSDALWSDGSVKLFQARAARAKAASADAAPWRAASDSFRRSWELNPGDGAAGVRAVQALEEASRIPGAPSAELSASADELMAKVLAAHVQSAPVLAQSALRALARAQDPATKKPDAKTMVDEALGRLAPLASKKDPDLAIATAWNDLVSFQLAQKMGLKHAFRLRAVRSGEDLEIQVPLSQRWRVDESGREPVVRQFDADGAPIRWFSFRRFQQNVNYQFKIGEASGGNITALAQRDFEDHRRAQSAVTDAKEPAKGRVSAKISGGVAWEVLGTSIKEKKEKRMRTWFWKSGEGRPTTYAFVCEESKPQDFDAAARSVLDSLVELPAKK